MVTRAGIRLPYVVFHGKIANLMGEIILNVGELFVCSHAFVSITERANGTKADRVSRRHSASRESLVAFSNTSEDP
jgi:hypothetical protein